MLTKISIFHAPSVHNTWAKEGILIHSGDTSHFFYRFKVFNRPVFGCRLVDDADDVITWGTGIGGAKSDYQTFERMETIEVDFEMFADELKYVLDYIGKERIYTDAGNTHPQQTFDLVDLNTINK